MHGAALPHRASGSFAPEESPAPEYGSAPKVSSGLIPPGSTSAQTVAESSDLSQTGHPSGSAAPKPTAAPAVPAELAGELQRPLTLTSAGDIDRFECSHLRLVDDSDVTALSHWRLRAMPPVRSASVSSGRCPEKPRRPPNDRQTGIRFGSAAGTARYPRSEVGGDARGRFTSRLRPLTRAGGASRHDGSGSPTARTRRVGRGGFRAVPSHRAPPAERLSARPTGATDGHHTPRFPAPKGC